MRFWIMVLATIGLVGCENTGGKSASSTAPVTQKEEHDHVHGPHGGPAFELSGFDGKVEAITSNANNLVQVFFLNSDAKATKPIKAEKVVVKTDKLGGKSFDLKAANADANGLAAEFSLDDKELKSITPMSPTLEVTIDGKTYSGTMEFH